jgi:hypothetical protein
MSALVSLCYPGTCTIECIYTSNAAIDHSNLLECGRWLPNYDPSCASHLHYFTVVLISGISLLRQGLMLSLSTQRAQEGDLARENGNTCLPALRSGSYDLFWSTFRLQDALAHALVTWSRDPTDWCQM